MAGLTATDVTVAGTDTVTFTLADLLGVCTLVAVTTSLPPVTGAVYRPALVIMPFWADQVTELL